MAPVDPVVRAKLAVWLMENGAWDEIDRRWRFGDGTANDIASRLLGLPPSVRAQLLGLDVTEEWALKHAQGRKPEPSQASALRDAEETNARYAGNYHYRGVTAVAESRLATSWQPFDPPVGVAGRNQPNPKEGDGDE